NRAAPVPDQFAGGAPDWLPQTKDRPAHAPCACDYPGLWLLVAPGFLLAAWQKSPPDQASQSRPVLPFSVVLPPCSLPAAPAAHHPAKIAAAAHHALAA